MIKAFLLAGWLTLASAAWAATPPRLMLTPERIDALRKDGDPTQQELKQAALASAAEMVAQPIPEMRDANNRLRRIGDTMPVLGLAYRLTGERRYAEAADRWLQALLAVPEWKGSQNLGRSAWVVGSALLYDWLRDELPESTRARLRERLAGEGELLLKNGADFRLLSNHCLIETSALGMIGLALRDEHPRAAACLQRARERADAIIQYAPLDGSWGEGVQYWQYGLGYFLRYLEASKTAGDRDYYPRYEWLKQTGFFPIHFSLPGQPEKTVDFSDSGENDYVADFLMYLPAAVYRNGYYQDFANKTRATKPYKFSWMDFIAYDPGVKPADFTTLPQFRHFADNGFVIARSGWGPGATLVAFHCGPSPGHRNQADPERLKRRGFGPGHGHPDINSFSLYSHGEWLVLDPGYVHEKWTRDENTVLVNGRGQAGEGSEWLDYMAFQAREPAPKILHAESNEAFDYIIGDAGNVYVEEAGLRHFRRHLLFLKPDVVVILDDLAGKRPAKFEWRLQAKTEPVRAGKDSFEIRREGVRLAIQPLLPMGGEARIETRPLKASATDGKISTLDLAVENVERTTFLVALCVMPGAAAKAERAPEISYTEGKLEIRRGQKSWRVVVGQPDDAHPGARLLRVEE